MNVWDSGNFFSRSLIQNREYYMLQTEIYFSLLKSNVRSLLSCNLKQNIFGPYLESEPKKSYTTGSHIVSFLTLYQIVLRRRPQITV